MNDEDLAAALDAHAMRLMATAHELSLAAAQLRATPKTTKTLLSLEEAAEAAGLSLFSVRRLLSEGTLTEVRVGRRRLVSRASLDALGPAS